jgi:SCY1-like protein 1
VELPNMIYIVTDYVTPLPDAVRMMQADFFNEAVSWGIYSVVQGLNFLHSKRLYHGCISAPSIYVDQAGEWKIGELGFLSEVLDPSTPQLENTPNIEANTYGFPMKKFYSYLPHKYKSPEVMSQRWDVVEKYPDRVDSFGVGCLLFEVFEGPMERIQDLKRIPNKMPRNLISAFNQLILDNPVARMPLPALLNHGYFNNTMVETCLFLDNLSLKDPVTIETFLTNLPDLLDALPKSTCKHKILPLLINAIKFGSGGAKAIEPIFKISKMMNEEEFKTLFIPKILDLFESNDRTVRVNLLKNLNTIMPHLTSEHVEQRIYPNVAKGFKDSAPVLREMTVKAMIELAPRLSSNTVNDDLIRNLWTLQADKEASIRTNSVIAIGKLAASLDEKTRKKVLLPAFARSLRDPFLHSRLSALRALLATKEYYSVRDIAQKLLPVVTPLMVDPERGVRDLAVQCTNTFLTVVTNVATSSNFDQQMAIEDGVPYTGHVGQSNDGSGKPPPPPSSQSDSYYNWAVSGVSSGVSALKSKVIGGSNTPPPPPTQHAPTSGYGSEPAYNPPKKQLQNPDLFSEMEVKKPPKDSLILEHKNSKPAKTGWEDEDPFAKSAINSFFEDDGFDNAGSGWDSFDIKPVDKVPAKKPAPKQQQQQPIQGAYNSGWDDAPLQLTKQPTRQPKAQIKTTPKSSTSNAFDDPSFDEFGSGGGLSPKSTQPPLQPKKAQLSSSSSQLRTEHRNSPNSAFQMPQQQEPLQPKRSAPANKKKGKNELEIDWDAF